MNQTKIILKNAVIITLLIGGYFFLCKFFGQENNPYLRFMNLFFVVFGIRKAIMTNIYTNKETKYTTNLGLGIQTSAVAVLLSIIGVIGYIELINPEFLSTMNSSFLIGGDLTLAELFFTLLIEGMASSVIGSFVIMQFFKNHNKVLATA
ncbi:hypothetical protein [Polaribacter septentrionalilitoris]|uniref:hypothetical protein n=1 Tax=Polaribacter septentrionalilitoris TaxID=2494657 RepID=UPI001357C480|nr:hypothetical protein [Polaribacter septentrionalilitoris]